MGSITTQRLDVTGDSKTIKIRGATPNRRKPTPQMLGQRASTRSPIDPVLGSSGEALSPNAEWQASLRMNPQTHQTTMDNIWEHRERNLDFRVSREILVLEENSQGMRSPGTR